MIFAAVFIAATPSAFAASNTLTDSSAASLQTTSCGIGASWTGSLTATRSAAAPTTANATASFTLTQSGSSASCPSAQYAIRLRTCPQSMNKSPSCQTVRSNKLVTVKGNTTQTLSLTSGLSSPTTAKLGSVTAELYTVTGGYSLDNDLGVTWNEFATFSATTPPVGGTQVNVPLFQDGTITGGSYTLYAKHFQTSAAAILVKLNNVTVTRTVTLEIDLYGGAPMQLTVVLQAGALNNQLVRPTKVYTNGYNDVITALSVQSQYYPGGIYTDNGGYLPLA